MSVITRFAPSPTGFLHIGGARTALFNWLYARHHGGQFVLRIEDTDRARSTRAAIDAILAGLNWLGLDYDAAPLYQSSRAGRHAEVARALLAAGRAYHCYASAEELTAMREEQKAAGKPLRYDGRWRERDPAEAPAGVPPVIRLKAEQSGETVIEDQVQGRVTVKNDQLDDMVLLRADGTPTYMLAVVVDDHDMGISHVIRGDDHLTNAFRQTQLYRACAWDAPRFAHIPLIHGPDGAKMSKRHGAVGLEEYHDLGFLPEAMRNYLLRLGWAHGDEEIISTAQAIRWFDLDAVGRAAARFDQTKLTALNAHYLRHAEPARLVDLIAPYLVQQGISVDEAGRARLVAGMAGLQERAKTLVDLAASAAFYLRPRPIGIEPGKAEKQMTAENLTRLALARDDFATTAAWDAETLEARARALSEQHGFGLGKLAQPARVALTGSTTSPPLFEVMAVLGREETLARLDDALSRGAIA